MQQLSQLKKRESRLMEIAVKFKLRIKEAMTACVVALDPHIADSTYDEEHIYT